MVLAGSAIAAEAASGPASTKIGYATVAAARKALLAKPKVIIEDHQGWTLIIDEDGDAFTTWTFPPRTHPAYPSLLRRDVVAVNRAPTIVTHLLCEAGRRACDQFYALIQNRINACERSCTLLIPQ